MDAIAELQHVIRDLRHDTWGLVAGVDNDVMMYSRGSFGEHEESTENYPEPLAYSIFRRAIKVTQIRATLAIASVVHAPIYYRAVVAATGREEKWRRSSSRVPVAEMAWLLTHAGKLGVPASTHEEDIHDTPTYHTPEYRKDYR